ncbi:MAG: PQQ-dependent sugar dehydrogenase [Actinomycetota bacterium]
MASPRTTRRIAALIAVALLAGCTNTSPPSAPTSIPVTPSATTSSGSVTPTQPKTGTIVAEPVATGLDHPATFVLDHDGAIYYGERLTGEIRRIDPTTGKNTSVFTIPAVVGDVANEQGLVGLTLPPDFPQTPWLYAYATRMVGGVAHDQIVRIHMAGTRGTTMQQVLDVQVAGERHNGGRMLFGPDGMLYVVVGETYNSKLAQDRSVNGGKVLRMTPSGGVPADNPFPGSRIFSYGNRNSFGLAFDPQTGELWETENGPECNDELNHIQGGHNYGWGPSETCTGQAPQNTNADGPKPVLPQLFYPTTIGPTGIAFCDGCGLGTAREGHLLFGAFNTGDIHEVTLNAARTQAVRDATPFNHGNLVLSIERGPDGTLYFSDGVAIFRLILEG